MLAYIYVFHNHFAQQGKPSRLCKATAIPSCVTLASICSSSLYIKYGSDSDQMAKKVVF